VAYIDRGEGAREMIMGSHGVRVGLNRHCESYAFAAWLRPGGMGDSKD